MISNNIARHRETFCAECGGKTGGGRLCDDCLPPNQSELEEQFDREHPIAADAPADADNDAQSTEQDYVVCPKCNKEVRPENAHQKIRTAFYNHLYRRHVTNWDSRRDFLNLLDELTPGDSPELTEDDAAWEASLASMGKEIVRQSQQGAAEKESEPATEVTAQSSEWRIVECPIPGCSWKSSLEKETGRLKQKLHAHLNIKQAHKNLSPEERLANVKLAIPETLHIGKSDSATADKQDYQERILKCPCGSMMTASSPRTKLDTLVSVHVDGGKHRNLSQSQRYELKKKLLPDHRWRVPEGYEASKEESGSTPISVHQAVQQPPPAAAPVAASSTVEASSPLTTHQASPHKTLLLLDGTNGFSFAGCGAFLERMMKPFLESRVLKVEIVDTGPSLRMTMEMRKEAAK